MLTKMRLDHIPPDLVGTGAGWLAFINYRVGELNKHLNVQPQLKPVYVRCISPVPMAIGRDNMHSVIRLTLSLEELWLGI